MTSWSVLKDHIKGKYVLKEEAEDVVATVVGFESGRRQAMYVRRLILGDDEWAEISTPVCVEADVPAREALERNSEFVVGGLALLRSGTIMYRHAFPLKDLDIDEFEVPFQLIAAEGDRLEHELTGRDTY